LNDVHHVVTHFRDLLIVYSDTYLAKQVAANVIYPPTKQEA